MWAPWFPPELWFWDWVYRLVFLYLFVSIWNVEEKLHRCRYELYSHPSYDWGWTTPLHPRCGGVPVSIGGFNQQDLGLILGSVCEIKVVSKFFYEVGSRRILVAPQAGSVASAPHPQHTPAAILTLGAAHDICCKFRHMSWINHMIVECLSMWTQLLSPLQMIRRSWYVLQYKIQYILCRLMHNIGPSMR